MQVSHIAPDAPCLPRGDNASDSLNSLARQEAVPIIVFKRPFDSKMNGTNKSHGFETPSALSSHPYPHIKKIRLTLGSIRRMQTHAKNHHTTSSTLSYPDTDGNISRSFHASSSSPSLTTASTDIGTPKSSSLDSPSPPYSGYREDSGWGAHSTSSTVSTSSLAFSPFEVNHGSAHVDSAFYLDSHLSHLANISIEDEKRVAKLASLPPSTNVDPLEETDSHKEGTERKAREYVRKCLSTNRRLTTEYHVNLLLGWGGNGAVLGARRLVDNKPVAIKVIYKGDAALQASEMFHALKPNPTPFPDLPSELRILMGTRHCNIIHFMDWFEDAYAFYMVSERVVTNWHESCVSQEFNQMSEEIRPNDECMTVQVPNPLHHGHSYSMTFHRIRIAVRSGASDLFSYIDSMSTVPFQQRQSIFSEIARSLAFLHERGITHGDLKEENILLTSDFTPKLCDFGHARKRGQSFRDTQMVKRVAFYGTRDMTPPELLSNLTKERHSPNLKRYSGFEADVWALGLLLYSMCTGTLSTEHRRFIASASNHTYVGVYDNGCLIYPGRYDRILEESNQDYLCVDLLKKLLRVSPTERWTMEKVMAHPWVVKGLSKRC